MKIKTTLAVAAIAALAVSAGPAFAKTSVQGGQIACKAAFAAQTPAPSSARVVASETKATSDAFVYLYRVKVADAVSNVTCKVDLQTGVATLSPPAPTQSASAK